MHNVKIICNQPRTRRTFPILQDGEHHLIREEKQKWSPETCVLRMYYELAFQRLIRLEGLPI